MNTIVEKVEAFLELGGVKKDITFLVLSGISLLLSMFHVVDLPFDIAWVAIILCGVPIILEAIIGLVTEFDITADVLVSLALIASVLIGEEFAAGEVAFIMQIGGLLEELTVARARAGIEKLVHLTPQIARRIVGDGEEQIPASEVEVNDILRVLPGETVPVDGVILKGQTSINQAVMTGESLPVDKTIGDEVSSGTVNQFGSFEMKATKVGEDSSIQRMIRLVQSADASKAKIVGMADRWAVWIVIIALTTSALTWLITGEIIRAVTILVVFCPCSLVLATPTAIMAAIGNATKHGFLVREGDALERLAKVKKITFDKTGTLTVGKPKVTDLISVTSGFTEEELYRMTASVERHSEHPLGKAIVECYRKEKQDSFDTVTDFDMIPGQGVKGVIENRRLIAGNQKMMEAEGVTLSPEILNRAEEAIRDGGTVIYVAIDRSAAGMVVLTDTLRADSASMLTQIKALDIEPVLLTGDNEYAAGSIAKKLGITEYKSECLPQDKLEYISSSQDRDMDVCMIGDGINDAPALKQSNVGIAMGGVGSDIAVDAADIALVDDDIKELPHLLALSKKMMVTIKSNLAFSMILNFAAIALAITGILNPVVGALVHNAGSVVVIVNSALLLRWQRSGRSVTQKRS